MAAKGFAVTSLVETTSHILVHRRQGVTLEERQEEHQEGFSAPRHSGTTPGVLKGEEGAEMENAAIAG